MASIVAAIIAIAKAIPAIAQMLNLVVDEWQKYQISQIEDRYKQRQIMRAFLTDKLKSAKDDNERITAFRLLSVMD
jgi:hypothetical protein